MNFFLIFSTDLSETLLIPRRIQRDIINTHRSSSKVLFILVGFLKKVEFPRQALEKSSNTKFRQILSVGAKLFHENGRTDRRTRRET